MDTLLIVGAESVVGANVACTLSEVFSVIGWSRGELPQIDECRIAACPSQESALSQAIDDAAPAWIVVCGAAGRASWDAAGVSAQRIAEELPLATAVAAAASRRGSRLTYLSSDCVFAGPRLFHAEQDTTTVTGPLAEAALAAEQVVCAAGGLVVRTHAYGWSPVASERGFAERCWQALTAGLPPAADAHRHATPILASDLAALLHAAYRAGLQGLYHLAGAERVNPRRLASELAAVLGLPRLHRPEVISPDDDWQRSRETSLISRRGQQALQLPLPMLREGLLRFCRQAEDGYRDRLCQEEPTLIGAAA